MRKVWNWSVTPLHIPLINLARSLKYHAATPFKYCPHDIASVSAALQNVRFLNFNLSLSNREGEIHSTLAVFDQEKPQPVCLLAVCSEAMMQRFSLQLQMNE